MNDRANFWPSEQQTLLLRAGLMTGEEALAAWRRAQPGLDGSRRDPASRRLLPLVYVNLMRQGTSAAQLSELGPIYQESWLWNQRLLQRTATVIEALADAGIPSLVLKGIALTLTCYGDPGARPMGDIDVLVPAPLAASAGEALGGSGWLPRYAITPAFVSVKHAAPFNRGSGEECDLHWRILEEDDNPSADADWWASAVTVELRRTKVRVLCPTDQLLHVCVHGARWARTPQIRWVADAMVILRSGGIDWPRLVEQTRGRRFALRVREALCYLAKKMQAPIPAETLAQLASLPVSRLERFESWSTSREHRLLGELPHYWCQYRRGPRGTRPVTGFARHLQRAWGLDSVRAVPGHALTLATRRLIAPLRIPRRARAMGS